MQWTRILHGRRPSCQSDMVSGVWYAAPSQHPDLLYRSWVTSQRPVSRSRDLPRPFWGLNFMSGLIETSLATSWDLSWPPRHCVCVIMSNELWKYFLISQRQRVYTFCTRYCKCGFWNDATIIYKSSWQLKVPSTGCPTKNYTLFGGP